MAFGESFDAGMTRPNAEINMIPLVDVMLVLLVIFIVTAPLLTHAIRVELPQVDIAAQTQAPEVIDLTLDEAGALHWNGSEIERVELTARLREAAAASPQPQVQLRAARHPIPGARGGHGGRAAREHPAPGVRDHTDHA